MKCRVTSKFLDVVYISVYICISGRSLSAVVVSSVNVVCMPSSNFNRGICFHINIMIRHEASAVGGDISVNANQR